MVWWRGIDGIVYILVLLSLCGFSCIFRGLSVVIKHFIGTGYCEAQDGAVVGVTWPLSSGLVSGPFSTLNEHFRL